MLARTVGAGKSGHLSGDNALVVEELEQRAQVPVWVHQSHTP
jgi:hypothetical protein